MFPTGETTTPAVKVKKIDLLIEENTEKHNTDQYDVTDEHEYNGETRKAQLVVRRGQEFDIKITLDRSFEDDDKIKIVFEICKCHSLT